MLRSRLTYREDGQAAVEFAIVAVVLAFLIAMPIDLYRYAAAKMVLSSATSEALSQISADEIDDTSALSAHALDAANNMYGDKVAGLAVSDVSVSPSSQKVDYDYRVYSSDRANESDQFEARSSNYSYKTVKLSLSCDWEPVTFLGTQVFGNGTVRIEGDALTKDVLVEGYRR